MSHPCFLLFLKGNMYTTGEAGKVDLTKAAEYFTKAAEKGAVHVLLWFCKLLLIAHKPWAYMSS